MRVSIVIPTYNEAENLPVVVAALLALPLEISVLVVDDNSPDGSGSIADQLGASSSGRVCVLHRPEKMGIASAYMQGFQTAINKGVDAIAQIDGDFSHDPAALVSMVKQLETCDAVFGSRYIKGSSLDMQWPAWCKGLSTWGNFYARTILRMPLHDVTIGYRLWKSETLQGIPLSSILSKGYIFQKEMPIHFTDRCHRRSKMSLEIQFEEAFRTWQIWLTHRHLCHQGQAARIHQTGAAI